MSRGRLSTLVIGKKKQGKSTLIKQYITALHKAHNEPALILVDNDPPAYDDFERLSDYNMLYKFVKGNGIAKFYDFDNTNDDVEFIILEYLRKHFVNGTLVIEDASPFVDGTAPRIVKRWFTNHKNYGIDLFTTFHSIDLPPKFLIRQTHKIVLFKTQDDLDLNKYEMKKKYTGCFDAVYKAWKELKDMPETNNYIQPYKVINTGL